MPVLPTPVPPKLRFNWTPRVVRTLQAEVGALSHLCKTRLFPKPVHNPFLPSSHGRDTSAVLGRGWVLGPAESRTRKGLCSHLRVRYR